MASKLDGQDRLHIGPFTQFHGEVRIPGSKSLSNRALLLAAVASGVTKLSNLLDSDDVNHMLSALHSLGVHYELSDDRTEVTVHGLGGNFQQCDSERIFLGNAGTAMRPLTAMLALSNVQVELTGEPRMAERPIGDLVNVLTDAGADITYLQQPNFPPLQIRGTMLRSYHWSVNGSLSSQFLTALLMAAPMTGHHVQIDIIGELVSTPYIDITLDIMRRFGITVENHGYQTFVIAEGQQYQSPGEYLVEGDASSASYFLAAGAILGGPVTVHGVGKHSIQGDLKFAEVLEKMGATLVYEDTCIRVSREQGALRGIQMDMNHIPDAAMTIATTALFAQGKTRISNVYNWRVKETDRLHAMATELLKTGADVIEGHDFIEITPPQQLTANAVIDTYNDHRVAMCFALLSLQVPVAIRDPGCTAKTFPTFFEQFLTLAQ